LLKSRRRRSKALAAPRSFRAHSCCRVLSMVFLLVQQRKNQKTRHGGSFFSKQKIKNLLLKERKGKERKGKTNASHLEEFSIIYILYFICFLESK
jgi:hypothetical protein